MHMKYENESLNSEGSMKKHSNTYDWQIAFNVSNIKTELKKKQKRIMNSNSKLQDTQTKEFL